MSADGRRCEEICKHAPPEKKWPCIDCDMSIHDRAEPPKEGRTKVKPRMIHPRVFLFSQRVALGKAFEKWATENKVALCWENFVAFLDANGMLNKVASMEFLKKEEEHAAE